MKVNLFRAQVFANFSGARAYLHAMVRTIPEAGAREITNLKQLAESEGWPYDDYDCERQGLESLFEHTMPRVLYRSFLVYLHSTVEVQLHSVAERLREQRQIELRPTDIAGSQIDKARVYFEKVLNLSVASDPGWAQVRYLAKLRNVIVHRGSRLGRDASERKTLKKIAEQCAGITASRGWENELSELEFSPVACLIFTDLVEAFFDRLFSLSGLGQAVFMDT